MASLEPDELKQMVKSKKHRKINSSGLKEPSISETRNKLVLEKFSCNKKNQEK